MEREYRCKRVKVREEVMLAGKYSGPKVSRCIMQRVGLGERDAKIVLLLFLFISGYFIQHVSLASPLKNQFV